MDITTWLEGERGRARALAAHLGLQPAAITHWKTTGVPLRHMSQVAALSGGAVTVEEMARERVALCVPPSSTPQTRGASAKEMK